MSTTNTNGARPTFRTGVSFHTFTEEYCSLKWSFEDLMELAAQLGGGVEIVGPAHHRGFPSVTREFVRSFRSSVLRHALTPVCYGSYADPFTLPDRDFSDSELVDYTIPQLHVAAELGFPIVRLQFFTTRIVEKILPLAEKLGLRLGYELHAPLEFEAAETKKLIVQVQTINSPHLGLIPDCGIFGRSISQFRIEAARARSVPEPVIQRALQLWHDKVALEDALPELLATGLTPLQVPSVEMFWGSLGQSEPGNLETFAANIIHMHGKFFTMRDGDEPDIRYEEVVAALVRSGYSGWLSTEYEGPGSVCAFTAATEHQAMIRRYIERALVSV